MQIKLINDRIKTCPCYFLRVEFAPYIFKISVTIMMAQYGVAMYAVFQSGGKQHRVTEGQTVRLEKLELEVGATVEFDNVLMIADGENINVGAPYVAGGKVVAEVVTQARAPKVTIVKFKRRKHSRKQAGHRQWFTEVKITGING